MAYTTPSSFPAGLPFQPPTSPYTVPTSQPISLQFGDDSSPGTISSVTCADQSAYGTATIALRTRYVSLDTFGIDSAEAFGDTTIILAAQAIEPGGIAPNPQSGSGPDQEVPPPDIALRTQFAELTGIGPPPDQVGSHDIAFYYQFIDQTGYGHDSSIFGSAEISYRDRYVYPDFIIAGEFGTTVVLRTLYVAPTGFGGESIPTSHELEDFSNKVRTHSGGADPAGYGVASVRNAFEYVRPSSSAGPSSIVNFPAKVYNQSSYLLVRQYMDTDAETAKYGVAEVVNRNRVLTVFGHQDSRFSFYAANVYNNAAAIVPAGLDATLWGNTLVAYRNRNVVLEGFDGFFSAYHIVYNGARVVVPSGIGAGVVGVPPSVVNRNRTIAQFFPYEGESVGTAFVAYRIRSVSPTSPYDVAWPLPEVRLNPYPITPVGIDSYSTGGHYLTIHFNTIAPYAVNVPSVPRIGEPFIQNRNKTITPYAYDHAEWGTPTIDLYRRPVIATAGSTLVVGAHTISYRTKVIDVSPFSSHDVSVFAQVRNVIPDPPSQQYIIVLEGMSIVNQVSEPSLLTPTLSPLGINGFRFGSASVNTNAIFYRWEFDDAQVGIPRILGPQYLNPSSIPIFITDEDDPLFPKPRISPHTVYAPSADQATAQAMRNHPGSAPEVVDAFLWSRPSGHFGEHDIANYYRALYPTWGVYGSSPVGEPTVSLRNRRVYPNTFRPFRAGVPRLNGAQPIYVDGIAEDVVEVPRIEFVIPMDPTVYPLGADLLTVGNHDVTLQNRQVYPTGVETSSFGDQLVGYPRLCEMEGYVATLWGTTDVSHYTRFVFPEGFDALEMRDTLSGFNDRMKVTRRNPPAYVQGFDSLIFGDQLVATRNRYVLPISTPPGSVGAYTLVSGAAYITPTGIDSLVVGDIDRWESGKIKAHGDDLALYGTPRINRTVTPVGIVAGTVGNPTQARQISPAGFPPVGFEGPSVTDPYGCSSRVVTPFPILPGTVNANSTVSAA